MARPQDLADESTIWVGSMFPTHAPLAPDFVESVRSVDLARRDFLEVSNGLPSPRPGAPPRPIAVVQCDDGVDASRAARHLVDDVGVPAIIGFARSKEVVDLALSLFNPRGVMALAANTAPMLSSIPGAPGQPRMVWRVAYSSPMLAGAMAAVVRRVEVQLRASHAAAPAEPLRVLLVRVTNATGIGVSDAVVATLRFNGKSVAENGERAFREVAIPDLTELDGASPSARVLAEVAAFRPHVVLDTAAGAALVGEIEAAWPASERARPVYVLQGTLSEPEYAQAVAHDPTLARRVFGVDTDTQSPSATKYVLRRNEVFQPPIDALEANDAPYDAFYAFAYLAASLGDAPIDGPSLARAIPHIVGGTPVDVGPAGIYAALAALGRGETLDIHGAATSLDFDPVTGDASARFAAFTFCPDAGGKLRPAEAAFSWESRAPDAVGELRCP
jgi:branched-chain amino acid transport system substrate-binding protein